MGFTNSAVVLASTPYLWLQYSFQVMTDIYIINQKSLLQTYALYFYLIKTSNIMDGCDS